MPTSGKLATAVQQPSFSISKVLGSVVAPTSNRGKRWAAKCLGL
ncbi:hypothetical protein RBSH_03311 [Rhodopirellula baltica SH28]|uniref:Uncharacterized protein n=1 Tax=Rhodopirellula baltica SH28 TaxID=993517 RepID=K5D427_RHOBT|nr:hypothetical protein RBSH_03311 [Rhodopirellula baltica SH28]